MEQLLLAMMNRGYYIYTSPMTQRQCVRKEPMCNDNGEILCADFGTLEEALEWVKKEIDWKEPAEQRPEPKQCGTVWDAQLMYKHRAFKQPRFESLGMIGNADYEMANKIAKETAAKFVEENFEEKDIENWEVRVRPMVKSKT